MACLDATSRIQVSRRQIIPVLFGVECFYITDLTTSETCKNKCRYSVASWHIDIWEDAFWSCEEHLQYIKNCIEKKWHNRAVIKQLEECETRNESK